MGDTAQGGGPDGVGANGLGSPCLPGGRAADCVKVKHVRQQSAVVCGWKPGVGGRSGQIGSLLLVVYGEGGLSFIGHVGTGFSTATLGLLEQLLAPLSRSTSPFAEPVEAGNWVEPVLVVEVEFTAWTREGRLRHPSYKGIRTDLDPAMVTRE